MCTGAEIAMLAAAAASSAASYMSAEDAADDRRRAAALGAETEAKIQDKANDATETFVKETFDPTTRQENYEAGAKANEDALGELLSKNAEVGMGDVNAATTGKVSDTYTRAKAQATADSTQKARNQAKLLSRGGALGGLFGNESLAGADYSSDMLGFGVDSRMNRNLTNMRYGQAGGNNELALLGGLLAGAGQAYGSAQTPKG